jgi:DNA-binding response OmpR family regulator
MKISKKILIIEDEKTLAKALELKLTHSGFDVKAVFNGEDGIKQIEKSSFDLILLDLIMPRMDGFTVLKTLKTKGVVTPVMVLSNLSQEDDIKRSRQFGAVDFFIKSNTPITTIVERVIKLLK